MVTVPPVMSYHFSNEQHAFPGGGELFARENRQQGGLVRPGRVGSLDVPHGPEEGRGGRRKKK